MTRREFASLIAFTETAFAQRAVPQGTWPAGTVWLNANENPYGPPEVSVKAVLAAAKEAGRYHFNEFGAFYEAVARSEGLDRDQVVIGAGSTEVLNSAVAAFTSAERPLILPDPTFEAPAQMARALARRIVTVPLTDAYAADVKRLAAEADKAGGGLIYICNPNNPTSSLTPHADLAWLVSNLPRNAVLAIDEAYIHFADSPRALPWVKEGKDVVVVRTFSKIYGMAGLRIGFGCAKPELARAMRRFHINAFSAVGMRAVAAALEQGPDAVAGRRAALNTTRGELCAWLREHGFRYIEPHANFVMIDIGRSPGAFGAAMLARGVAVGRPFPPLNMLRVTIGAGAEMARFKKTFLEVARG